MGIYFPQKKLRQEEEEEVIRHTRFGENKEIIESIWFMNNIMLRKIVWDEEYVAAVFSFWMESQYLHTFLHYVTHL